MYMYLPLKTKTYLPVARKHTWLPVKRMMYLPVEREIVVCLWTDIRYCFRKEDVLKDL